MGLPQIGIKREKAMCMGAIGKTPTKIESYWT